MATPLCLPTLGEPAHVYVYVYVTGGGDEGVMATPLSLPTLSRSAHMCVHACMHAFVYDKGG